MSDERIAHGNQYRPSPASLARLRQVRFVAVVGPSASGKTTLIRRAVERHRRLRPVVTTTSRPRRDGEVDGVDYHFRTRELMAADIAAGRYAQVAPSLFGDLYATAADDYATDGVTLMPVLADAVPDFEVLPFAELRVVFVAPPDLPTWQRRLAGHGFDPATAARRMGEAVRSLDFALDNPLIPVIRNDDLERAVAEFTAVVLGWPGSEQTGGQEDDSGRGGSDTREYLAQLRRDLAAFHPIKGSVNWSPTVV